MKRILIVIGIFFVAFSFGLTVGKYEIFPYKQTRVVYSILRSIFKKDKVIYGRWHKLRTDQELTNAQKDSLSKVGSLPYLKGYNPPRGKSGVTIFDRESTYPGFNLICSGHAPKVFLMDMEGTIIHEWAIPFEKTGADSLHFPVNQEHKEFIRRAHLFPNGDLLAIFEYIGIIKFDKNSNIIWSHFGQNHHDLAIDMDGDIYSLGSRMIPISEVQEKYPRNTYMGDIRDDLVVILSPDGKEIKRFSIFDAFYLSPYASYLNFTPRHSDIFHANSIQIIDESTGNQYAQFDKGDILVSLRNISTIIVIDSVEGRVKWSLSGMWSKQHKAVFLENGNIMLLDNLGGNSDSFFELNRSRIIEFNPNTQEILWQYRGSKNNIFFTKWLGYNQRLPNGNTLITEADQGRIFEVSRDNEIVWEHVSPFRAGKKNELIATVMSAIRVDPGKLSFIKQ